MRIANCDANRFLLYLLRNSVHALVGVANEEWKSQKGCQEGLQIDWPPEFSL
jgi:hypothetical protein